MNKKIRFLKVTSFYDTYLNNLYTANIELDKKCYSDQLKTVMNDCFAWADFWKKNLESTGLFEVMEVIANAPMQKTWANERKINFDKNDWEREILMEQILEFKPEIVFIDEFSIVNPSFRNRMKRLCPSIKLTLAWDGIAINNTDYFSGVDIILSCVDFIVDFYQNAGMSSYFFRFGFEKSILDKIKLNRQKHEASFVGSINLMKGGHFGRLNLLSKIINSAPIDLFLSGNAINNWGLLSYSQRKRLYNGKIREWLNIYNVGRKNHGEAFGLKMYQILADSKISINNHIDLAKNKAANIRLVESTGVGSCLLTDWKENISDYFIPDKEIVVYDSPEDCVEKIIYLINNENIRSEIAKNGQEKTLSSYTFEKNVHKFADYLINNYDI